MLTGDDLVSMLGMQATEPVVMEMFRNLVIQWRPETSQSHRNDWIAVANAELGFEDATYFNAADSASRANSSVLQQICVYATRPGTSCDLIIQPPCAIDFAFTR